MSLAEQTIETDDRFEIAAARILSGELPIPVRLRWQPLRAGLMNLFLFEDERFPFADGRLLLRGSNGTGKSRVLAMTLPLLLDGSFKANRVEPDRDPNRQVVWNLLMDDQTSRTGYSWLEFGRLDETGEHFLTIGCGMKAVRGQAIKPWFFLTTRRVDDSLSLKTIDGVPLTQRQLAEALGEDGQVIETATDYRRAVDDRLFRLGDRYDPLIDLLLQLRQPQLARKLDLDHLESALRMALPPLPETLLGNAADAFRELDSYRTLLAADRRSLSEIQRFLNPYRQHVRRGVKRALKQLTSANSRYETAQRELRDLHEKQQQGKRQLEQVQSRQQQLRIDVESASAAIQELDQSPEMRDARRLDELRERARRLTAGQATLETELIEASRQRTSAEQSTAVSESAVAEKLAAATTSSDDCRNAAAPESLQNQHHEQMTLLLNKTGLDSFAEASKSLSRAAERFLKSAQYLITLNDAIASAQRQHRAAREAVDRAEQRVQQITAQHAEKQDEFKSTRDSHWETVLAWFERATVLREHLPPIVDWSVDWHAWTEAFSQSDPLAAIVQAAHTGAITQFAADQSRLRNEHELRAKQLNNLHDERERLEAGDAIEPKTRPHRNSTNRLNLPGMPFWKAVEFQPNIPQSERGNWEAALEDSGLLDAWLTPDGRLLSFDAATNLSTEIQLAEIGLTPLEHARQLARVLRFADDPKLVDRQIVERILSVIGVGADAGPTWVASDGSWQNGPLHGRWIKADPQFIGEESRARWRQLRLDAIRDELDGLASDQQRIELKIAGIDAMREQVATDVASLPNSQPLLTLNVELGGLQRDADIVADELRKSQHAEAEHATVVEAKMLQRDCDAAVFNLSSWAARATELQTKLQEYQARLMTLDARVDTLRSAISHSANAKATLERSITSQQQSQSRFNAAQIELGQCREKVRAIEETVGQGVTEIIEKLTLKRRNKDSLESQSRTNEQEIGSVKTELAVNESGLERKRQDADQIDKLRRTATEWFSSLHSSSMLEMIVDAEEIPPLPWSMTQAIKLARRTDGLLEGEPIDDETWQRSQNQIHQAQSELQPTILAQDGMAIEVDHLQDGLQRVTLTVQGERLSPVSAVSRLESDVANRERILDEREQETLEKYLLGEVAEGLRNGMREAARLVELMTLEVSKRPMKSGMQMRFKWRRDDEGPLGLAEACEVLAAASATWSPEEREQIKIFLQQSIRRQRETEATGSWHEHLRAALDYRNWHRIVIERRSGPDANWLRLTRRTYASGSGGEKAIGLTLPQLAAAAAYYETADPLAPRFILLDEAFAGVSPDMRESCMELIASFRLDVVMTSEIEWGCYPGVPQLAICQLDRFAEFNAVVNRVFVWNGLKKGSATSREEQAELANQPLFQED